MPYFEQDFLPDYKPYFMQNFMPDFMPNIKTDYQGARERSEGKYLSNVEKAWGSTARWYTLKWAPAKLKY